MSTDVSRDAVDVRRSGDVVTITLNRPAKRNAMTDEMWQRLELTLTELQNDTSARVVVLAGAGGAFCGGSDVTGLLDDLDALPERMRVSNRCVQAVHDLPIPTIALVDGVAAGSGVNLALACDFVLATDRAQFAQLFIRRGLSLDSGASWLLPRLVGDRRARQLALLGDALDAPTALAWGMVNEVVEPQHLATATAALVDRLCRCAPRAVAGTKALLNQAWEVPLAEALEAEITNQVTVINSPEAQASISAFRRKSDVSSTPDAKFSSEGDCNAVGR
ncbi:enoyl-CoA hydratase [Jatrophihabitans sp. GAS493]|uniref:enoyl-CoA hydratase/isomerase family protein n=1 Tax=Jatrophihabitans sp. GAS493 TaxID=1907575 RepID=UPI000BB67CC4|nr:enoyl-CoA hydratase-related protein [Jatrophihabitans sp. GAS493]SOD71814.1 enoyl-CoA hydratase [Jatrophihabitans sp. GAS493]